MPTLFLWFSLLFLATLGSNCHLIAAQDETEYLDHSPYDQTALTWGDIDRYEVTEKIGSGTYCDAFLGIDRITNSTCVIKILKPIIKLRLQREIRVLQLLNGGPNIVKLLDAVIDANNKIPALVFEHCPGESHKQLYHTLNSDDIQYYIYQIVRALAYVHGKGIMHRDIKPQNIMINHRTRDVRLIDFGLGEFYHPGQEYNVHVASRYFRGPELLVGDFKYDYRLDMWSLGCIFAGMIFGVDYFFKGRSDHDQLVRIVKVLGKEDFYHYLESHHIQLDSALAKRLKGETRQPWNKFMTLSLDLHRRGEQGENQQQQSPPQQQQARLQENDNKAINTSTGSYNGAGSAGGSRYSPEALDFLDRLLRYDFRERMSSEEALHHPYLAPIHKQEHH